MFFYAWYKKYDEVLFFVTSKWGSSNQYFFTYVKENSKIFLYLINIYLKLKNICHKMISEEFIR